jgi:branched-chain amino acid transport system ATP-binding protein
MTGTILAVEDLQAGYDVGAPIVRGVRMHVLQGEIVTILGPNGAGKSTLIKALGGLVTKFAGRVLFKGQDITNAKVHELARAGLGFVPQTENVFGLMSIADNLKLAADVLPKAERQVQIDAVFAFFPDLARQRHLASGRLSGGQRQMLAVARALITKPQVLMLDEASAGLSPKLVGQVFSKLIEIRAAGTTILLVEQNAKAALAIADRALILVEGKIAHEGASDAIIRDPAIGRLYLGVRPAAGAA